MCLPTGVPCDGAALTCLQWQALSDSSDSLWKALFQSRFGRLQIGFKVPSESQPHWSARKAERAKTGNLWRGLFREKELMRLHELEQEVLRLELRAVDAGRALLSPASPDLQVLAQLDGNVELLHKLGEAQERLQRSRKS